MKNNLKTIIASSVAALAFGAVSVGTTFALFTDKDDATIDVNAGKIDVACVIDIDSVFELNNDEALEPSGEGVYVNSIGGSTSIDGNTLVLNNWAPGDKAIIDLQNVNKSTVKALTRLAVSHGTVQGKGDLYPALNIVIQRDGEDHPIDPVELFKWVLRDVPENTESGDVIDHLKITIEFPDHDNGEIVFGSENNDNQYQDCACVIGLGVEAVQGNAYISPIQVFNSYSEYMGNIITMSDAVREAAKFPYSIDEEFAGYVWDAKNYCFVEEEGISENFNQYFKAYSEMPSDPSSDTSFSIYANAASWTANVEVEGIGFDAGSASGIASISYVGLESARENIIVSNSLNTAVTVNAPLDVIHHYGEAGSTNIEAIAGNSYHENGIVGFTEISKGRIVLEKGSEIKQVHVNANSGNTGFEEVILKDNGARALPEKITRDAVTVEEKELVITIELPNESSEEVYVYAEGSKGTTEKTEQHNADVESDLGRLVLDNGGEPAEKALEPEEKAEEKEEAIIEIIDETDDFVARIGTTGYETFNAAWSAAKNKTLVLLKNVTLNALQISGAYTIDLNGNEMTLRGHPNAGTTGGAIYIDGGANWTHGNLTIENGTLNMPGTNFATYGIYNYGTLTIRNAIVNSACNTAIYVNGQNWGTAGTTNLDSVVLNSTKASSTAFAAYALKGSLSTIAPTVHINNCNITGVYDAVRIYACEAYVRDTDITAGNNGLWISRAAMASGVTNTLTVSGDVSVNASSDYSRVHAQDGNSIVVVTGVYNFDPTSYVDDNYYSITESGNSWIVEEKALEIPEK